MRHFYFIMNIKRECYKFIKINMDIHNIGLLISSPATLYFPMTATIS